jgi:hypothetical protein
MYNASNLPKDFWRGTVRGEGAERYISNSLICCSGELEELEMETPILLSYHRFGKLPEILTHTIPLGFYIGDDLGQ